MPFECRCKAAITDAGESMSAVDNKSAARLLVEAASIARFAVAAGWPDEFQPGQLAALMAGGWKGDRKGEFETWRRMIDEAIRSGSLATRVERLLVTKPAAGRLSGQRSFVKDLYPVSDGVRIRLVRLETKTPPSIHHIGRAAFLAWLRAIKEEPSEHVAEWLRTSVEESACEPCASAAPPVAWSRGMKRVAWEEARKIVNETRRLNGPALWSAITARDDAVTISGKVQATYKNASGFDKPGEESVKEKTVKGDWRKQLADLLGADD